MGEPTGRHRRRAVRAASQRSPDLGQQAGQVRVERVPPGDVVVHVGQLGQADPVALAAQHLGHRPVVGQVLLQRAAGQRRRHRLGRERAAAGLADEPGDPRVPAEAPLLRVEPAGEERAGLQEQPAEQARVPALRVQRGQRRRGWRPSPTTGAGDRDPAADRRQHGQRQRLGVADVRAVPLVPVARTEQRDPVPGQPAGRRHRRRVRGQAGQRVVLRAVVRDQQRQRLGRAGVGRRPDPDRDLRVAGSARAPAARSPRRAAPARPARPAAGSPANSSTDLSPNAPGAPQRVGRVADLLDAAVRMAQLQPVLHPPDRRPRQRELPVPPACGLKSSRSPGTRTCCASRTPASLASGSGKRKVTSVEVTIGPRRRGAGPERHRTTLGFALFG